MLKLSHTVLYAKDWYAESGDLISDLAKTLKADGYENTNHRSDIARVLLARCDENKLLENTQYSTIKSISAFYEDYMDMAIIKYCLSMMRWIDKTEWEMVLPNADVLPLNRPTTHIEEWFSDLLNK